MENAGHFVEKGIVNDWLLKNMHGKVQSGPFIGMEILPDVSWNDGDISSKILGTYEQELHPIIEHEIKRLRRMDKPKIVNVGTAEGYYAVGMAMQVPKAVVYG